MSNDILVNGQRLQAAQLHRNIATAIGNEALSSVAASQAAHRAKSLQGNVSDLNQRVENLEEEVNYYKNLLAKPMHEIAHHNENFKKTYDLQQELLADWMVSQKAFKELAINLGLKLGIRKDDIIKQGNQGELAVLNSENAPEHNTNADNSERIKPYVEKLKEKTKKK